MAPKQPDWTPEQVRRFIAERDEAREALRTVVDHCFPNGASPELLRRCDAVWRRAAEVLWG